MEKDDCDEGNYSYKIEMGKKEYLHLTVFYWPNSVTVEIDGTEMKRKLFKNLKVNAGMDRELSIGLKKYTLYEKRNDLEPLQIELKELMQTILPEPVKYHFYTRHVILSGSEEKSEFIKRLLYSIDTLYK